jgi:hypothetical protein
MLAESNREAQARMASSVKDSTEGSASMAGALAIRSHLSGDGATGGRFVFLMQQPLECVTLVANVLRLL